MGDELRYFDDVADAVASGRQIPITGSYPKWAGKSTIPAVDSPNHGCSGSLVDLMNLVNNRETVLDEEAQRQKFDHWASTATLCGNEFFSRAVYSWMNLTGYRGGRDLWKRMDDPELSEALHEALRSALAHFAIVSYPVAPLSFSDRELARDGNCVFVADQRTEKPGCYSCAAAGPRSANDKQEGTAGKPPKPGSPSPIRNWNPPPPAMIITEACKRGLDRIGKAFAQRGMMGHWLTAEEAFIFERAVRDDYDAIRRLWEWAILQRPGDTFHFLRFKKAAATLIVDAHASSTSPAEACWVDFTSGASRVMVVNPVHREHSGGADNVRPTTGRLVVEQGVYVFYCRRMDKSTPEVRMVLGDVADLVFHGENGPGGSKLHKAPWLGSQQPEAPAPPVTPAAPAPKNKRGSSKKLMIGIAVALAAVLIFWFRGGCS